MCTATPGLRERKKERTRELIATTAARALLRARLPLDDGRRRRRRGGGLRADDLRLLRDEGGPALRRPPGARAGARRGARRAPARDGGARHAPQLRRRQRRPPRRAGAIRWEIVRHDELLLSHQRMRQAAFGEVIAKAIARELGRRRDDLRPQLVTAAVIAAFTRRTSTAIARARSPPRARSAAVAA